jgi:hypothetical protein
MPSGTSEPLLASDAVEDKIQDDNEDDYDELGYGNCFTTRQFRCKLLAFLLVVGGSIAVYYQLTRPTAAPPAVELKSDLTLKAESKVVDCVPGDWKSLEASGVIAVDGSLIVNFDNLQKIAIVDSALAACNGSTGKIVDLPVPPDGSAGEGSEAITRMPDGTYTLIQETFRVGTEIHSRARKYSNVLAGKPTLLADADLDFKFESDNKGIEGVAAVHHRGTNSTFLLALCEGNHCRKGSEGRAPGGGTILVFHDTAGNGSQWALNNELALPPSLPFIDFSGLDLVEHGPRWRAAIVSQTSSGLWLGSIEAVADASTPSGLAWQLSAADGHGVAHAFPLRAADGALQYCNVEGVSFLPAAEQREGFLRMAFASDKAKKSQGPACQVKGQSVHVFEVPL